MRIKLEFKETATWSCMVRKITRKCRKCEANWFTLHSELVRSI